jgi:hypothetical protein
MLLPVMLIRTVLILLSGFILLGAGEGGKESGSGTGTGSAKSPVRITPSVFILDKGRQTVPQFIRFMTRYNAGIDTQFTRQLLQTYMSECDIEGVNHDVAICQMCLETGFLRFNGSVSRFQHNYCGLGATSDLVAGDWFGSMEEGIRAHIQHLKAYASVEPLRNDPVDKRFRHVARGTVFTIFDLAGKWASDPRYGEKLHILLNNLFRQ